MYNLKQLFNYMFKKINHIFVGFKTKSRLFLRENYKI